MYGQQNFYISFLPDLANGSSGPQHATGLIRIGKFQESFPVSLKRWSQSEYQSHWKEGLLGLLKNQDHLCLVVCLEDVLENSALTVWLLCKKEDQVYFQKQDFKWKDFSGDFESETPTVTLPKEQFEQVFKNQPLSLPLKDIEAFAELL